MRFPWSEEAQTVTASQIFNRDVIREIQAPNPIGIKGPSERSVFLAGTIDMGNSENWQQKLFHYLRERHKTNWVLYNPRRDDWDSSWTTKDTDPQFYQQVNWELNALEKADKILLVFLSGSKSPISLLEMGMYINSGKLVVVCPEDYERSGNVKITCERYGVPIYENLDEAVNKIFR